METRQVEYLSADSLFSLSQTRSNPASNISDLVSSVDATCLPYGVFLMGWYCGTCSIRRCRYAAIGIK